MARERKFKRLDLQRQLLASLGVGRYAFLVIVLLIFFFWVPFTQDGSPVNIGLNLAMVASLLATVRRIWPGRGTFILAASLGAASLAPLAGLGTAVSSSDAVAHWAALLLILLVVSAILSHVLAVDEVTIDIVIGAAAVYLFLGFLWGSLYVLLEHWFPGSFRLPPDSLVAGPTALLPLRRDTILLYYSFETLTTLGTGDVVPLRSQARFLSVLEAIVGQLYLAVLVARFVSLQVSHRGGRKSPAGDDRAAREP